MNDNSTPILVLFCGLPGSAKTTLAKQLEAKTGAVRLCTDEWVADLGVKLADQADSFHSDMQSTLWKFALSLLKNGHDVIFEDGLWLRRERDARRNDIAALNVTTEMHYFDLSLDELIKRLVARNAVSAHGVWPNSVEEITRYYALFEKPDKAELALFDSVVVHTA